MWFVKPVFPYVPSLSEYLQTIILPTHCFVKLWRKFLTLQRNCSIYKEEAVGEMDIAQLIFYVALCLLPENFIITLCNLMQQKKKTYVKLSHPETCFIISYLQKYNCYLHGRAGQSFLWHGCIYTCCCVDTGGLDRCYPWGKPPPGQWSCSNRV